VGESGGRTPSGHTTKIKKGKPLNKWKSNAKAISPRPLESLYLSSVQFSV
jgi:hypothetical protein